MLCLLTQAALAHGLVHAKLHLLMRKLLHPQRLHEIAFRFGVDHVRVDWASLAESPRPA